jgi:transposase InsO family protein
VPWKDTTPMRERAVFIRAWEAEILTMKELCEHFGVSRKTGYKWVNRYREGDPESLVDRSRAPRTCPHRTPAEVEAVVIEMKREHTRWGPKKIIDELQRTQPKKDWPAVSTAGAILKRAGLVKKRKRRRRWQHPGHPPLKADRPNELMTVDFKGEFRLGDKSVCYPLTIQDRFSRYVMACKSLPSPRLDDVRITMESLFREVGLPERIRTDNGEPFASHGISGLTRLNVWWMCLGVRHERIDKGCPYQNGAHERMHQELKAETTRPPAYSLSGQQTLFDDFVREYNKIRPHEGIDQQRPSDLWIPSPRSYPEPLKDPEYPGYFEVRRVRSGGEIKFKSRMQFVSQALAGQLIGLEPVDDGVWSVIFCETLLGRLDERTRRIYG